MTLDKERKYIAKKVRDLRLSRSWTQSDLAEKIGVSQSRLSEIETGSGSFTAEQLIAILRLFHVSVIEFAPDLAPSREQDVQNALARFGASQLVESDRVLPSEQLSEVHGAIREALVIATPRLVTALAPLLVVQSRHIRLPYLHDEFARLGLERRLGWVVANTLEALAGLVRVAPSRWKPVARKATFNYDMFLAVSAAARLGRKPPQEDVLDATIRSKATLEAVRRRLSPPSQEWGIITSIQPADFMEALEASDVGR